MKYWSLIFCFLPSMLFAQSSNLFGKVVDEDGVPYSYIELELEDLQMKVTTDKEGEYKFENVPIGEYPLKVYHKYGPVYKAIYMDGADFEYDIQIRRRIEFDEIIVATTRANTDEPVNREILKTEKIRSNDLGRDLPYALKSSRSIFVNSDAGTGIGYTGIRIRGLDPSHVNVTLNGIPLNNPESQLVFWVDMPDILSSTESIEIQRGIGGSTFGAGDFGAAISVNTNKIHTRSYLDVTSGVGSYATNRGSLSLGTGLMNNKYTIDGRISYLRSDGYIDRARAKLNSIFVSAAWLGLKSSLRLNVLNGQEITYQAWNGVPVNYVDDEILRTFNSAGQEAVKENPIHEFNKVPHKDEVDNYNQTHIQLFYSRIDDLGEWSSALYYTRGLGYFELFKADANLKKYNAVFGGNLAERDLIERRWLDNHFIGANVGWKKSVGHLNLRAATAYNIYLGDHYGQVVELPDTGKFDPPREYFRNDALKSDFNTFVKGVYNLNEKIKLYADLQYRRVDYSYKGVVRFDREIDGDKSYNFVNPKIGVTMLINDYSKLFGYVGIGNKEPNRDDFVDSPNGKEPKPERMNNVELGYEGANSKLNWGIHGYWMGYTDQLVLTGKINDVGEYARSNTDESYRFGVELEIGAELLENFFIEANATWSQNKIAEYNEYIDDWDTGAQFVRTFKNTSMALSPEVIGFVGLSYHWKRPFSLDKTGELILALDHKYVGQQYLDNTESEIAKINEYNYADASVRYVTSINAWRIREATLKFKVINIYNSLYVSSGWNYRFATTDPNNISESDQPYVRNEIGDLYNQTGLFPQAPLHFLSSLTIRF